MLNYIPRNWGWYVAAAMLFGPYFLLIILDDEIVARITGLSVVNFWAGFILIWALLQHKNVLVVGDTWLTRKYNAQKILFWSRILLLCLTVGYFYFSSAYIKDILLVFKQEAPIIFTANVINIRVGTGALSVILTLDRMSGESSAYYFPRNTFEEGYTYKFWYLPNTREIVKAELVSTNDVE